jgi:hypothetical protein
MTPDERALQITRACCIHECVAGQLLAVIMGSTAPADGTIHRQVAAEVLCNMRDRDFWEWYDVPTLDMQDIVSSAAHELAEVGR